MKQLIFQLTGFNTPQRIPAAFENTLFVGTEEAYEKFASSSGKSALNELFEHARRLGCGEVWLCGYEVRDDGSVQQSADIERRFYLRHGGEYEQW